MEKIKLGIIGIGNMGTGHINNILAGKCPEIELTAVADINPSRLDWAKEKLEGIICFDNADDLINSGVVDSILVAVPHYGHVEYSIKGFKKGLHVMCEKPAGVYTKQVIEMNEEAKKHDVVFGMMFNQRTNPMYIKMRELVKSGEFGEIRRTNWLITNWFRSQCYYDSSSWRATWAGEGGGVLLNQCPHQLDLWQWICGMPKKITAYLKYGAWHDIEVEDDVTAFCEYENGATGTFITSTGDYPGSNRFEIAFDKGKIVAEGNKLTVTKLDTALSEYYGDKANTFSAPESTVEEFEFENGGGQHVDILNAFAGKILHGTPLIAEGQEGINGLTVSNAMHLSAFLGETVELPLDADLFYEKLMEKVKTSKVKEETEAIVSDTSGSYAGA